MNALIYQVRARASKIVFVLLALAWKSNMPVYASNQCLVEQTICSRGCTDYLCVAACGRRAQKCIRDSMSQDEELEDEDAVSPSSTRRSPPLPIPQEDRMKDERSRWVKENMNSCVELKRSSAINGGIYTEAQNDCQFRLEIGLMCSLDPLRPMRVEDGRYAGGWRKTLGARGFEQDPNASMCYRQGGIVRLMACRTGTPWFTSADGSQGGCRR